VKQSRVWVLKSQRHLRWLIAQLGRIAFGIKDSAGLRVVTKFPRNAMAGDEARYGPCSIKGFFLIRSILLIRLKNAPARLSRHFACAANSIRRLRNPPAMISCSMRGPARSRHVFAAARRTGPSTFHG